MNGPEHYRIAERLLRPRKTHGPWADGSGDGERAATADEIAAAQVHATLAMAAALGTLDAFSGPFDSGYSLARARSDSDAWQAATATSDD